MLTLPPFTYHAPATVSEAVALLAEHRGDVKLLAGGTDLLPNMKHRLFTPAHLVGLRSVRGLAEIAEKDGAVRLGPMVSIARLARDPLVEQRLPSLQAAAQAIAGPQLRQMGTLGGNLCLDTRCVFYNQTAFWRLALGYCLKKDGTVCHVVKAGKRCVAAASNDTAPALLTLGARIRVAGPLGTRDVALADFYFADGVRNLGLQEDEVLTGIEVPSPEAGQRSGFQKLRVREAVDYPSLSVAVSSALDAGGNARWVRVAVSALGARPHLVGSLESLTGSKLTSAAVAEIGRIAHRQCHPLTNINIDPAWRRDLIPVLVKRAFETCRLARAS